MFCLTIIFFKSSAQKIEFSDSVILNPFIDSLIIDRDRDNWSARTFVNLRGQRFTIADDIYQTKYVPTNPFGIGIGFATKKIILDAAIGIKGNKEEATTRFEIKANFNHQGNFIDFHFKNYRGFNVHSPALEESYFDEDINSLTTGFDYLYLINKRNYPAGALRSVISDVHKSAFVVGVGGFALLTQQSYLGPVVVSESNNTFEEIQFDKFFGTGLGLSVGSSGILSLGANFYTSLALRGGVGMMYKNITSTPSTSSENIMLYQLGANAAIAYVTNRYYLNLTFGTGFYQTEYIPDFDYIINMSNAKVVFGYKIFTKE